MLKILFWSYIIAILLLVTLPLNSSGSLNNINIISFRGDYFFHALLFIPWAFLGPYIKHKYSSNKQYHAAAVRWLFIGLIFSSAAEVIQYFLQYRAYNINDLLANSIGVLLGFTIFTTLIIFKYKFNKI